MNASLLLRYLLWAVCFGALACQPDAPPTEAPTTEAPLEDPFVALEDYGPQFQKIMLTEEGVLRGVDFGMNRQDLIAHEVDTLVDERDNSLLLTVSLDSAEAELADITYVLENDRVARFLVEVYLNDEASLRTLRADFESYLSKTYTAPARPTPDSLVWPLGNNRTVSMSVISQGRDQGLTLVYR